MTERVTLRFQGLMLEKFLERALEQGVRFDSVRRTGRRRAVLVTDGQGAVVLMALARQFALDVKEVSRRGPGVWARKLGRRWTLPAALALCGALSLSFLSRLWIIDVGMLDESGGEAPIFLALEQLGYVPGAPLGRVDTRQLALSIQSLCPEFSYVGVRVQGVRMVVEATRAQDAPGLYDPQAARDLVAAQDALLLSLDVMAGTAAAKPGQVVKKGQVLIRGEERDQRDSTRGVCALGVAIGRVWLTGQAQAPLTRQVFRDTGRVSYTRTLCLLDWRWPLTQGERFALERLESRRLPIGGLALPLYILEEARFQQREVLERADEAALKEQIGKIALEEALSALPEGVQPVDKWIEYSMIEGEIVRARAVVEIRPNIAVAREALNS